ncbi:lysine-specific histone demethylase 2 [Ciona intestinalis]
MEPTSSSSNVNNVRVSGRKAKRKTFDDFIPMNEWSLKPRKRRSIDSMGSAKQSNSDVIFTICNDNVEKSKIKAEFDVKDNGSKHLTEVATPKENNDKNDLKISLPEATKAVDAIDTEIGEKIDTNFPINTVESAHDNKVEMTVNDKQTSDPILTKVSKPKRTPKARQATKREKMQPKKNVSHYSRRTKVNADSDKKTEDEISEKEKLIFMNKHSCKKSGCKKIGLTCCIQATNACMEASGKSSRWYHVSLEEHYCNGCFEEYYRIKHSGCDEFHEWKKAWMNNSKADANFKSLQTYISERQLPYWVQCTQCGHWRSLTNDVELTSDVIRSYTCIMGNLANSLDESNSEDEDIRRVPHIKYSCSQPNEQRVENVLNPDLPWMNMLGCTPYLKHSPAAPFLTGYYPDGVGMSAVDTTNRRSLSEFSSDENDVIKPPGLFNKINKHQVNGKSHLENKKYVSSKSRGNVLTSPGGRKHSSKDPQIMVDGLNPYFQPFYKPHERGKALCMRPDVMELDEAEEFPEYYKEQTVYLAIRNLIVSLWTLDPKRILTISNCCDHLILRGLTRVRLCSLDAVRILQFATRKGLINTGALQLPRSVGNLKEGTLPKVYSNQKVVVIGAGPAGIAAARQLHNFGCEVVCLEARLRLGGRVDDDWSLDGVCVGRGAQIINGCVNNPLALVSQQLDLKMHRLLPRCDLYDAHKVATKSRALVKPVSVHCDKRMDFHFNALLDIIVEWRQAQQDNAADCSLGEKIQEAHQEWIKQSGLNFTELEERLLNFHIGNLEFACGASLDKVSAFHWDQNEVFAQFSGDHTFVQYGFGTQLSAIAYGLDIRFEQPVTDIIYNNSMSKVEIKTKSETYEADRVLITVPLAVLRSGSIQFEPPLPPAKVASMNRLGCGCIEKIGILFPKRFWDSKMDGANYFGYVPLSADEKGFFTVFYDVPYPQGEDSKVLMSVISGDCVDAAKKMKDKEILDIALSVLRNVFSEKEVPEPSSYFVTRWNEDPYSQMAYSFVKKGGSGEDYDEIAKSVAGRLFFAGEGTNRHFPQTVTGAYLSGLREASKIAITNKDVQSSL